MKDSRLVDFIMKLPNWLIYAVIVTFSLGCWYYIFKWAISWI